MKDHNYKIFIYEKKYIFKKYHFMINKNLTLSNGNLTSEGHSENEYG